MDKYAIAHASQAESIDLGWGQLDWYAGGPWGNSDHLTLGRCTLKPGQQNPRHYHPNCEEVLHVLSGTIEHYIEGIGWFAMNIGDTVTIAADVRHHARNTGDTDALLLICFSSPDRQTVEADA